MAEVWSVSRTVGPVKMLMFHVREFWYQTHCPNLDSESHREEEGGMPEGGLLAWLHVEPRDVAEPDAAVRKCIKNLKWLARKVEVSRITLHSFAHLGDERAEPPEAQALLDRVAERLRSVDFEVHQTPWGFFNEFRMHVEGPGLAKVWKEF